jgi:hypothetical protein
MNFVVGNDLLHLKYGSIKIVGVSSSMVQLEKNNKTFWIPKQKLEEELENGPNIESISINDELVKKVIKLRLVYPPHAQYFLNKLTSDNGIILHPDTKPVQTGKRGGITIQRTVAAEIEFSSDLSKQFWPEGTKFNSDKNILEVNSLSLAVALLKAGAVQTHFV